MGYKNLQQCVIDLEKHKQLVRIKNEIDPHLEAGMIQRRVFQAGGPALLFENVKGTPFPMLANLFGTMERTRFLFRDTLDTVGEFIRLKIDPSLALKKPWRLGGLALKGLHLKPKMVRFGPVMECETTLSQLPQLVSWPKDGGAFITLPQVYTESVKNPGWMHSNLGMYRVQVSGNQYKPDEELGLHYQIHRGIGVHHDEAIKANQPFRVNIFVGGSPSMTLAAVMPLPEGMPEITFAGLLSGQRIPLIESEHHLPLYAEADFCITGTVIPNKLLPEGPFGDHLGYYSLQHNYPVLRVEKVFHRKNAIWPFTTVGRPPQEDTHFGAFIHELTGPLIPHVLPGVKEVHAVDAAGVHPLLLAIGSERYTPYLKEKRPQEILTQANAILGQGQLSLAKYLFMTAHEDNPALSCHDILAYFTHFLKIVDWSRDIHFQTCTTIDTLDYSGFALNEGSKVVLAAHGPFLRELTNKIPENLKLPDPFKNPRIGMPGILVIEGPKIIEKQHGNRSEILKLCNDLSSHEAASLIKLPLIIVVDDSSFTARNLNNLLWTTFIRSNPASDIYGIDSFTENKHWGCRGSLVIDARLKPQQPPPLEEDPLVQKKVDTMGAPGGPLHGII